MPLYCCVLGCKEKRVKGGGISFHSFPRDEKRRKEWEKTLRREHFTATKHTKICSKHFAPTCFDTEKFGGTWLKPDAVPTIFRFPMYTVYETKKETSAIPITDPIEPPTSCFEISLKMRATERIRKKYIERQPGASDISKHQTVEIGSRKERNTSEESLSSQLVEPKIEINLSEESSSSLSSHQSEQIESRKERNVSEEGLSSHVAQQVGPRKELNVSEESLSIHLVQLVEPKKEMNVSEESLSSHLVEPEKEMDMSEESSSSHLAQPVGPRKEMDMSEESLSNYLVQLVEPKKERNTSEESSTSFSNSLPGQVEQRKDSTLSEESETSSFPMICCNSQDKSYSCLDDFTEEDMDSPEKSLKVFRLAKMIRDENRKLDRQYQYLVKKVAKLEYDLRKMDKTGAISEKFRGVLEGLTTEVNEVKDQSPLEKQNISVDPTIRIKEEPVDDYSTPSTSNSTSTEEFILPHIDLPWTPTSPVNESQLTLSIACLNSPTVPEHSEDDPLKKKLRTDSFNKTVESASTPASVSTIGSTLTRLSVPIVPSNHIDIYTTGSLVGHQKKSTQNIILDTESNKYLNQTQDIKPTIRIKEEPADDFSIPSTSSGTSNGEFILPHTDIPWTTTRPVVESQITLSVASLNSPNVPEPSNGEPLNKKLRTDSTNKTPV